MQNIPAPTRYLGLDLLRFVAAFFVMMHHNLFAAEQIKTFPIPIHADYGALAAIAKYGYLGYPFFFVISGFVILQSAQQKTARQFLIARMLRLYPAFWICCTLTFASLLLFLPEHARSLPDYLINLTLLHGFVGVTSIDGPYWTLAFELVFYGWILLLIATRRLQHYEWFLLLGLLVGVALRIYAGGKYAASEEVYALNPFFCYFAIGSVIYLVSAEQRMPMLRCVNTAIALILFYLQITQNCAAFNTMLQYDYMLNFIRPTNAACIFLGLILTLIIAVDRNRWFKCPRLWIYLGNLSYPLYLLHQTIGTIIINAAIPVTGKYPAFLLSVCVLLALTALVHRYGEIPLRRMLRKALHA